MDEVELKLWGAYWETYFAIRGPIDQPWCSNNNEAYCTSPTRLASPAATDDNPNDTNPIPEGFDFATMLETHYRLQELHDRRKTTEQQRRYNQYPGEASGSSWKDSNPDTSVGFTEKKELEQMSYILKHDRLPGKAGLIDTEGSLPEGDPSDLRTAMEATPLQQLTKGRQDSGSSWIPPSLYGPPSPLLSAVQYPSVPIQPYYEDFTHGPVNQNGSSSILQPTKDELSSFQGAVAPTLEHLPPPHYATGEHPKLFIAESTQTMGSKQLRSPAATAQGVFDDDLQFQARKHVRKSKQRPRSEIGEKYGYHPALRYLWEPELAKSEAELAMAADSSEGSDYSEEEYFEGRWGPPTPNRPTTMYEDISAGGETPTTYVEDLPFHACYDEILIPRKYPRHPASISYEEPSISPEDPYERMDRQYREAQQLPSRGLDLDGNPIGFPIPKELKGQPPPPPSGDEDGFMEAENIQAPYTSWSPTNQPIGFSDFMEQVTAGNQVGYIPTISTQAHNSASLKRNLEEDETTQRKKRRVSEDRSDDYAFPLTRPHEHDEDLEYTQAVTESYCAVTGDLVAISTGWELRRRANASWRNQRRGKVFSRSQSPSPPSMVGEDSGLIQEGETLVDALSEASSDDPTMLDKEQVGEIPETEIADLSDKETSLEPVRPADIQHMDASHQIVTAESSISQDQSDPPTQVPAAMPRQKPEVVVPPLSPELRDQYIEYVYASKKNKGSPGKGVSRSPRRSSTSGQKKKAGKEILLKCDRVTRSTPTKQKILIKLDIKGKQAEPWDGQRDSSGGSPAKKVRAAQSSSKQRVSRVLSKTSRVTKRTLQAC